LNEVQRSDQTTNLNS